MLKIKMIILLIMTLSMFSLAEAQAATILIDGNSPETGSNLETTPLITPYGTITFTGGEVYDGGGGFLHDQAWMTSPYAEFNFDFDVDSISFLSSSMNGGVYTEALDINGQLVDSYHTLDFIIYHPVTLSGSGIRSFSFVDGRITGGWADVSDIVLTTSSPVVPEPISSILFVTGGTLFAARTARKRKLILRSKPEKN